MTRDYCAKLGARNYKNWSETDLQAALLDIAQGRKTVREASSTYHISYGTLFYRQKSNRSQPTPNPGKPTALTLEEEQVICNAFAVCADWGFPLSTIDLRTFAKSYLESEGRQIAAFKDGMHGEDWANGMVRRHSSILSKRLSQSINVNRARVGKPELEAYFKRLAKTLDGVPPSNIFNYDETAMVDCPNKKKTTSSTRGKISCTSGKLFEIIHNCPNLWLC